MEGTHKFTCHSMCVIRIYIYGENNDIDMLKEMQVFVNLYRGQ